MKILASGLAAAVLCLPLSVLAQGQGGAIHSGHEATAHAGDETESASVRAFRAISDGMHQGMNIAFTGDTDVDFIRGMIPHHQGAVAMAQVVLEHGKDEKVKTLAREIIAAQEAEIAMMREWLAARGH